MPWESYLQSLLGGALIGLAAATFLLVNGRVAGVSGVVGGLVSGVLGRIDGQAFERAAKDRVGTLVTLLGEPGVGKSRLISEFVQRLEAGASVFWGRCLAYGSGITLRPIALPLA